MAKRTGPKINVTTLDARVLALENHIAQIGTWLEGLKRQVDPIINDYRKSCQ